tara:strand:- start:4891 stop:7611 length:2721 start_codon:yes stop_codon:yes gene_type:complete
MPDNADQLIIEAATEQTSAQAKKDKIPLEDALRKKKLRSERTMNTTRVDKKMNNLLDKLSNLTILIIAIIIASAWIVMGSLAWTYDRNINATCQQECMITENDEFVYQEAQTLQQLFGKNKHSTTSFFLFTPPSNVSCPKHLTDKCDTECIGVTDDNITCDRTNYRIVECIPCAACVIVHEDAACNIAVRHPDVEDVIEHVLGPSKGSGDIGALGATEIKGQVWNTGSALGELMFDDTAALFALTAKRGSSVLNTMESRCNDATTVKCSVLGDSAVEALMATEAKKSRHAKHIKIPLSLILAGVGLVLLTFAVGNVKACFLTFLNIVMSYSLTFWLCTLATKNRAVLFFAPELVEALIIALGIDYSLFLLLPFVKERSRLQRISGADKKTKLTAHRIVALWLINMEVVLISLFVLLVCFATFRAYTADGLKMVGYCCMITVAVVAGSSLMLTPALLVIFEAYSGGFLLSELAVTRWTRLFFQKYLPWAIRCRDYVARQLAAFWRWVANLNTSGFESTIVSTIGLGILIFSTCYVFLSGQFETYQGFDYHHYLQEGSELANEIMQVSRAYGPGTWSRGTMTIVHNGSGVKNDTIGCIMNATSTNDGLYINTDQAVYAPNATLFEIVPKHSLRNSGGHTWYTDTLLPALKKCTEKYQQELLDLPDLIVMDIIKNTYDKFWLPGLLILGGVSLAALLLSSRFNLELTLLAMIGLFSMLMFSSAMTRVMYSSYQPDLFKLPGPGPDIEGLGWFPVLVVTCILTGIHLDYAILRLHAFLEALDKEDYRPVKLWERPSKDQLVKKEKCREIITNAALSSQTTIFAAGLIMGVSFVGVTMEKAPVAKEVGFLLIFGVAYSTWFDGMFAQFATTSVLGVRAVKKAALNPEEAVAVTFEPADSTRGNYQMVPLRF